MENIVKTYPCGLRVIVRNMPNFSSSCVSVFVAAGSRDEEENEFGISHFCEHMLFKGTKNRTSEQISGTLSSLGVEYNAYTSTSATCYHTRGLKNNLDTCCDILSDMYFNLKIDEADFKREAEVIVQEIAMHEDNPRSALGELSALTFFDNTSYGHSIAGTVESVRGFTSKDIYNYIKKHYIAPKTIVAFAGDVTLEQAEKMVKKYFLSRFKEETTPKVLSIGGERVVPAQQFVTKTKDTEQHNVAILFPVCNNRHHDKYVLTFINEIFSSDMASRLFSSVRDKLGLVYTISGGITLTHIGGYYYVYFSCTPKNTEKVLRTINAELEKLKKDGVTADEVAKVKNMKRSNRLFELENVEATNQRNAAQLAEFSEIETAEEYLAKINKVTAKDIARVINDYIKFDNAVVAIVGNDITIEPFKLLVNN